MKDILKAVMYGALFAVPFLTLYVENDYFFPFITGKNFWFRILVDVAFASWIILALYEVKYRPRFSWVVGSFGIFLVIMFFANLFGVSPRSSFWSNFERMDGYVSLVHTFLYLLVLGSVIKTKVHWQYLLNTSLVVALIVALYGLAQYGGLIAGSDRIDSRLGNAAYMAIYMLFHIFTAFWLLVETKKRSQKIIYTLLAVLFTFVLIETGTRGTALGLVVGVSVMSAYIGFFGTQFKEYRKYAIGGFILLVVAAGAFVLARDTAFVQSNPNVARIANISVTDLSIRATIWGMAWDGVKERPLLGYGQSNFNYVFNQNFDPALYAQEQWFDRAHNIFFDWLIAGGFLGLIAYLGIFLSCAYYLFWVPLRNKKDETFTVLERGVLLGLLAGYFTHNFVVFDNIVSYIFFAIILGLIHSRVSTPIAKVEKTKVDDIIITQFIAPAVLLGTLAVLYFIHIPGMQAAGDILKGFREQNPAIRLEHFETAISRNSFAHQEITEQIAQQTLGLTRDPQVSAEVREAYLTTTERELNRLIDEKPGDARVHVFASTYYRAINELDKASEQMAIARELSPRKQSIIVQQGLIALSQTKNEEAVVFMEEAFKLDERNLEAREYYAGALFYVGRSEEAKALNNGADARARFAMSDYLLGAANQAKETDFLLDLFQYRVEVAPENAQNWATLAFLYYEKGDNTQALAALNEGKALIPSFVPAATCIAGNIENGREPQEGCQ
jgi:O-antigen ligase/tetratricopeptide (TPR) repeat protein